ncbi:MAG TPA: hypothetical protein PK304_08025, partial [Mobilitalea sp.]|nr:hypothetical protein [Mobilitalea sp.]
MEKKKLIIDASVVDASSLTEEYLNSYESIVINASALLVSKRSSELLSRCNAKINASQIIDIPEDSEIMIQNGTFEITEGTKMVKPTFLLVNGHLDIKNNAREALKTFTGFIVNGLLSYPSDLSNSLPPININGTIESYPSDAIRLKNKLIVDKAFIIRAKNAKYYVKSKVIISDETLDISELLKKGTTFITKKAFITENLLESAVMLFEEDTEIFMIPAGYSYVSEENLDDMMIKKYGDKLYVAGDLIITSEGENALNKLSGLRVNGTVMVLERLAKKLLDLDIEYNELKLIKGNIIKDSGVFHLSSQTLSRYKDGITVLDCGIVKLDPGISPQEIEEKLQF